MKMFFTIKNRIFHFYFLLLDVMRWGHSRLMLFQRKKPKISNSIRSERSQARSKSELNEFSDIETSCRVLYALTVFSRTPFCSIFGVHKQRLFLSVFSPRPTKSEKQFLESPFVLAVGGSYKNAPHMFCRLRLLLTVDIFLILLTTKTATRDDWRRRRIKPRIPLNHATSNTVKRDFPKQFSAMEIAGREKKISTMSFFT